MTMKLKLFFPVGCIMALVLGMAGTINVHGFSNYKNMFFQAKAYLASGETEKALNIYRELYDLDTNNANIAYLMGVCYTEARETTSESIRLLTKAASQVAADYNAADHQEKNSSIFVFYYLAIAHSQNNNCSASIEAVMQFRKYYGTHKNDYFTRDALNWANKCMEENGQEEGLGLTSGFEVPDADQTITTKKVEYTTKTPLYSVQIGAFSRLVPLWKFENLNNVEAFMDKLGTIRYVMGHFNYVSQANTLLRAVWDAGYPDAFVVDINAERKSPDSRYTEEVVMVGEESFKVRIKGKVDYRVQVGAYRETIPDELVQLFLMLDGIQENEERGLTTLTVGSFPTYDDAAAKRKELTYMGIPGCFVVAYNYSRKVSVEEANNYVAKQQADQ